MLQTPPGSRPTSPVPVKTPVHRASRRIRGLPPDADVTLCTTSTGMASTSVQTTPTGTESTMRQLNSTSATEVSAALGGKTECLRELIRCIVREELHKAAAPPLPTVSSIASIIKDELHQALRDPVTLAYAVALPIDYRRATYAEALKRPASPSPSFVHAPPAVSLQSAQPLQYYEDARPSPPFVSAGPFAHRSEQPAHYVDDRRTIAQVSH
ncbi:hypothetical protein HPB52_003599 [Rhipicephalus sanguineus]|uniref:Uncharacterized protein n=1 Tax=Rhipicephalus sanguineus TaxID=34632 RepID=A0A9D4QC84_RHISA|nr:hypothetical protein HPB52_003599 [Rhipicephalus sanguineus]